MCLGNRVDINQALTSYTKEKRETKDDAKVPALLVIGLIKI